MILTLLIAFISLIGLVVLHELGHFILAKKFGIQVDEFGIGYPPRLFGKQFGETFYSLNLIPFGAFVKIRGEEGGVEDYQSFAGKPMWQRFSIVLGGVSSFWIISAVILGIVAGVWGLPTAINDEENGKIVNPQVRITSIALGSPAQTAQLQIGDIIVGFTKVKELQDFVEANKGKETTLIVKRGSDLWPKKIIPRLNPPEGEGAIGLGLTRVALKPYSWFQAPYRGVLTTGHLTINVVGGWFMVFKNILGISNLPEGVKMELMGPLGIFDLLKEYFQLGFNYFLFLVAFISISLALVNLLPIPALDGGKLMFLTIEMVRGKPLNSKLEQKITSAVFALLIILMIFITIKFDIPRIL